MILIPIARMILQQHKARPIAGDVMLIGSQTVPLTHEEAVTLIESEGVAIRPHVVVIDDVTTGSWGGAAQYVTDACFFSMFCAARVRAIDASSYEGADFVHDLNEPLPEELWGVADFVFDGSVLDNVFNPAEAMHSFSRMLRSGGRLFCYEHGTPVNGAYLVFTSEWFTTYLRYAGYEDINVREYSFDTCFTEWKLGRDGRDFMIVAEGCKVDGVVDHVMPTQEQYLGLWGKGGERIEAPGTSMTITPPSGVLMGSD